MELKLRELKGDDLFTMLNIIGQLEIEEEFKALFETNIEEDANERIKVVEMGDFKKKKPTKADEKELAIKQIKQDKESAQRSVEFGVKMLTKFIRNANRLKGEINPFLASLTGQDEKVIKELSLMEYTKLIKDFTKKEELKYFFSSIASLV